MFIFSVLKHMVQSFWHQNPDGVIVPCTGETVWQQTMIASLFDSASLSYMEIRVEMVRIQHPLVELFSKYPGQSGIILKNIGTWLEYITGSTTPTFQPASHVMYIHNV